MTSKTVTSAEEETTPTSTEETSSYSEALLAYIDSESPTFEDDFSTENKAWGRHSEFNWITEYVEGGRLVLQEQVSYTSGDFATYDKDISGLSFPINGLFNDLDFSLQFDFKFPPFGGYEDFIGIHFRSPYDENYAFDQKIGYAFYIARNRSWTLKKDNNETQLAEGEVSLGGNYNNLHLIVQGEYLAIFVNDELIYEKTDLDADEPGRFTEIVLSGYQDHIKFYFDNVKYWDLEGVEISPP